MSAQLSPQPIFQAFAANGQFLVGGQLFTYMGGTTTPQATFVDSTQTTQNTNPIILNAMGQAKIWLDPTKIYKYVLQDSAGNLQWTIDNIGGPLGNGVNGIDPSGGSDSTAALQSILNATPTGGIVIIPSGYIVYIANSLTIPHNITLKGPQSYVGTMTSNSQSSPYHTMGGQLSLGLSGTITMNAGSCIDGFLIAQHGLTFPQTTSAGFAGTAIVYNGDDCTVKNSMILAFNQAISSNGFQRPKAFDLLMDNINGILFNGSQDITHIERCHAWPFATFQAGVTALQAQRTGAAYKVTADGSGAHLIDCFSYGYNVGFDMEGIGEVGQTLLNCWADGTAAAAPYGTGFNIVGGATDTKLTACQASGVINGYLFSMNLGLKTTMTDCNAWGNTTHGIVCGAGNAGDVIIRGGYLRNNPNAISYANAGGTGILDIDDVAFDNSNGVIFNITVATTLVRIGNQNDFGNIAAGAQLISTPSNVVLPGVASASQINLWPTGCDFVVTGTTGISTAVFGWAGRQVTLYFQGVLTVGSGTGTYNSIRLNAGANFTTAAGSTLTIKHNGVQWYEIGRNA